MNVPKMLRYTQSFTVTYPVVLSFKTLFVIEKTQKLY